MKPSPRLGLVSAVLMLAVTASAAPATSPLTLKSSDAALVRAFDWAKAQALAYVFEGDPVGPWFEAALPRRSAFCMRDVSHQAAGGLALGLRPQVVNMLRKFAAAVSDARDWCSYWEINKWDLPAPVDYRNDKEFWYNLPANFDVLDACRRVFLWTGERAFVDDPVFLNYYRRSVDDYVARWQLGLDQLLTRPRYMNRPSFDHSDPYQDSRGIPSYDEGEPGTMRIGIDLPAFQAAAYRSYADLLDGRGDAAGTKDFREKSAAVRAFIERTFWDSKAGRLFPRMSMEGKLEPSATLEMYALYAAALDDPGKIATTLKQVVEAPPSNIEVTCHFPEIFYRYGAHDDAYRVMVELCDPKTPRREYPEVPYAVVGAMTNGMMGIRADARTGEVETLSRLTGATEWAEMDGVPVLGNVIRVRHDGRNATTFTNVSGPEVTWVARFYSEGKTLLVNGKPLAASKGSDESGRPIIEARMSVKAGETVRLEK